MKNSPHSRENMMVLLTIISQQILTHVATHTFNVLNAYVRGTGLETVNLSHVEYARDPII